MTIILESETQRGPMDFESISLAEIEVFGIESDRAGALHKAYTRYLLMTGGIAVGDTTLDRQALADQATYGDRFTMENGSFDRRVCVAFMHEICGQPVDQAQGWCMRVEAQYWRTGLVKLGDGEASDSYKARRW